VLPQQGERAAKLAFIEKKRRGTTTKGRCAKKLERKLLVSENREKKEERNVGPQVSNCQSHERWKLRDRKKEDKGKRTQREN